MDEKLEYMVYDKNQKRYLETIYHDTLSWDVNVDDALKFYTEEQARGVMCYVTTKYEYKNLCIHKRTTVTEEVE